MRGLLEADPAKRLTASGALQSAWISGPLQNCHGNLLRCLLPLGLAATAPAPAPMHNAGRTKLAERWLSEEAVSALKGYSLQGHFAKNIRHRLAMHLSSAELHRLRDLRAA